MVDPKEEIRSSSSSSSISKNNGEDVAWFWEAHSG